MRAGAFAIQDPPAAGRAGELPGVAGAGGMENDEPVEPLAFNNFRVRLAETPAELEASQALRYRVF